MNNKRRIATPWIGCAVRFCVVLLFRAIPHNSKCRYDERGAADAKPKAQIILDAAKVSAASGGNSEPKQGQRSQSARGFCPRSTMPGTATRHYRAFWQRRCRAAAAGAVLKPQGGNCAVLPLLYSILFSTHQCSILQNAQEYGGRSLPPPKSCGWPVIRSTAVPQPALKSAW